MEQISHRGARGSHARLGERRSGGGRGGSYATRRVSSPFGCTQYKGPEPLEVAWRNIQIQDLGRRVWKPIFDGRTLNGWATSGGGESTVEDGAIHGKSEAGDERIGFAISDGSYGNVTARVKFRIPSGEQRVLPSG